MNGGYDIQKTMMSRMRTMNPTMPPPAPYCHVFWVVVVEMGDAMAKERRLRKSARMRVDMVVVG